MDKKRYHQNGQWGIQIGPKNLIGKILVVSLKTFLKIHFVIDISLGFQKRSSTFLYLKYFRIYLNSKF